MQMTLPVAPYFLFIMAGCSETPYCFWVSLGVPCRAEVLPTVKKQCCTLPGPRTYMLSGGYSSVVEHLSIMLQAWSLVPEL